MQKWAPASLPLISGLLVRVLGAASVASGLASSPIERGASDARLLELIPIDTLHADHLHFHGGRFAVRAFDAPFERFGRHFNPSTQRVT